MQFTNSPKNGFTKSSLFQIVTHTTIQSIDLNLKIETCPGFKWLLNSCCLSIEHPKSKHQTFQTLFLVQFSNGLITGSGGPFKYLTIKTIKQTFLYDFQMVILVTLCRSLCQSCKDFVVCDQVDQLLQTYYNNSHMFGAVVMKPVLNRSRFCCRSS